MRDRDFIAGTFIWTGFDYLGEPTPYGWPSRSSYFGVVDLAGFPKDAYWLYQAEWTDRTVLHLFPHWNWEPGEPVDIWAYYNNADEVELFVNGESWGRQAKTRDVLHVQWNARPFEPGCIEVVSYKDGREVARDARYTAGAPVTLRLTPDRTVITADGYDLSYVTVEALDADGRVVPTADDLLHFSVSGAGELAGVDNGNAADTLSLKGSEKALKVEQRQGPGSGPLPARRARHGHAKRLKHIRFGQDEHSHEITFYTDRNRPAPLTKKCGAGLLQMTRQIIIFVQLRAQTGNFFENRNN